VAAGSRQPVGLTSTTLTSQLVYHDLLDWLIKTGGGKLSAVAVDSNRHLRDSRKDRWPATTTTDGVRSRLCGSTLDGHQSWRRVDRRLATL
jgi:hypothetical protein